MLNEEQTGQVVAEFSRNGKISAIKRYIEFTGASLKDAKVTVEALVESAGRSQSPSRGHELDQLNEQVMDSILDAIQEGNKVLAVKNYRDATGKTLRESKGFVESLMAELEIADPAAVGKSGCAVAFLMIGVLVGGSFLLIQFG